MKIQKRTELVELIKHYNLPLIAAEIGVAEGFHSFELLSRGIERLYCVDNWETIPLIQGDGNSPQEWHDKNFSDTKERLKEFEEKAVFMKGLSSKMAGLVPANSLGLLYLDGDHSYGGVMSDLITWFDRVCDSGIIAGHDFINPAYGVKQAVEDFCKERGFEINVIPELKEEDAGFWFIKK